MKLLIDMNCAVYEKGSDCLCCPMARFKRGIVVVEKLGTEEAGTALAERGVPRQSQRQR